MTRPASSLFLGIALVCSATLACSSAPTDHVGKDGKPVNGELTPNDPNGTPPNPNHDEGDPDPQDDQGEQPDQPGPKCDVMPTPIPEGWTTYSSTGFSVAGPSTGFSADTATSGVVQLFSDPAATTLGASFNPTLTLDGMVMAWTELLHGKGGHNCEVTTEATTYLCDDAIKIHGACTNMRSVEVMLVNHGGRVYFTSCDLTATGDRDVCAKFLTTLRFE